MTALNLTAVDGKSNTVVGRIGGAPSQPNGNDWPRCTLCDEELVSFLEIRLPRLTGIPFQPGSRLQVFACRQHDDIAGPIYSDYGAFLAASQSDKLPPNYWTLTDGHYVLRLLPPSDHAVGSHREERLVAKWIAAQRSTEAGADGFQLFGEPSWLQDPETHVCACGAPMQLLLQLPQDYGFDMSPQAPSQSNSPYPDRYVLFLGNHLYLFACSKQCHPLALWPVLQN